MALQDATGGRTANAQSMLSGQPHPMFVEGGIGLLSDLGDQVRLLLG